MYPSIQDIVSTIKHSQFIQDPIIKIGKVEKTLIGKPILYAGGYTVVFPFKVGNEKYAFRCWHKDLGNIQNQYEEVIRFIKNVQIPYFAEIYYEEKGILVNGVSYPTTRMQWLEGKKLKDFFKEHQTNKQNLQLLSERFLQMCKELHQAKVAHGDLQHGNIIIDNNFNIKLIDYDSLYVPILKNYNDQIAGLSQYQHLSRGAKVSNNQFEKLDYFSELIIYISILALIEKPELFNKYNLADTEGLFFEAEDFKDLKNSKVFKDLMQINALQVYLKILEKYCKITSWIDLIPFYEEFELLNKPANIEFFTANKIVILESQEAELSWKVSNAKSVTIDNGLGNVSNEGKIKVSPSTNTTYIITAMNELGLKTTSQIVIKVNPLPKVTQIIIPTININNSISLTFNRKIPKINDKTLNINLSPISINLPEKPIEQIKSLINIENFKNILESKFVNYLKNQK